jgi:large conductance mechanosensitive channel
MLKGFRDFILRGDVVHLAVAVVVGGAFNAVVQAIAKDLITPIIAAVGGQRDFSGFSFTINNSKFMVGNVINAIISFLIVASVVYFAVITPMNRIMTKIKKGEKGDSTERACPQCLSMIAIKAKRCKFCTARLPKTKKLHKRK